MRFNFFTSIISPTLSGFLFISMTTITPAFSVAAPSLHWERWPDLPDPVGLKGMYAGVSEGHIVLAGGSNFPVPRSQGGGKTFGRQVFSRPVDADGNVGWSVAKTELPVGLAEGAAVTTEHGVVGVGGQTAAGPVAEVFLLSWDQKNANVRRTTLPALPEPCANAAAVYWQGSLYVAGGETNGEGLARFWKLDLKAAVTDPSGAAWIALPSWPGPRRFGAVLTVLQTGGREYLFLFGGRTKAVGPAVLTDYLDDGYRYDPLTGKWTVLGSMPHRTLLAAAVRLDDSQVAIMGGSNGHSLDRMAELGERYRIPDHVAIYDARADRWTDGGRMPIGVVGSAVVELGAAWLVAGGEYSPSLRTAHVYRVSILSGSPVGGAR